MNQRALQRRLRGVEPRRVQVLVVARGVRLGEVRERGAEERVVPRRGHGASSASGRQEGEGVSAQRPFRAPFAFLAGAARLAALRAFAGRFVVVGAPGKRSVTFTT